MADAGRIRSAGSTARACTANAALRRCAEALEIRVAGHVQGVGFRPFVYRLAQQLGLSGSVRNELGEVAILVAGNAGAVAQFRHDLVSRAPPLSRPEIVHAAATRRMPDHGFEIHPSKAGADARIYVPPDYFMCQDCLHELSNPADRRHRYPFINCTQCGPRYTLIERLPYDRKNTSMAAFTLCAECEAEYRNPANRRFHAEPVACPQCGPSLSFRASDGAGKLKAVDALDATVKRLRAGQVVAVKGIGGYHLMCDAGNAQAVSLLRERKHRPAKPLAVMFPVTGDDGLDEIRRHASLTDAEAALVAGPQRPIVLVAKRPDASLAPGVAPGLRELGVFLPYSPLHQLLLDAFGSPLIATSGNLSGEPVLTDNDEATERLSQVADAFMHHNRPIVRPADDPVYRRIGGRLRPLRIGRGCAPCELELPWTQREPLLAVGGHMKGTVALSWDNRVVVSPHIGEMDSPRSLEVFTQVAEALQSLYAVRARRIVCDAHTGYTTHRWAQRQALPVNTVWHHRAHASALAGERSASGQWLIFTWDGVGLGEDGCLWGGEALLGNAGNWRRAASFRPFRLPGGERAGREPWRSAASLHWHSGLRWSDCPDADGLAEAAWRRGLNAPLTSAAGRLFDAAAALILGHTHASFEAEGPMRLESLCLQRREPVPLPLTQDDSGVWRSDWQPLLPVITNTHLNQTQRAEMLHSSLAAVIVQQAQTIQSQMQDSHPISQVGLCGGVFQNRVLTRQAIDGLRAAGFKVMLPRRLPCNDASLSFGQAAEVAARNARDSN